MTQAMTQTARPAPTLHRYRLPSINGEGWAIIVLGSDGFFSAVSDYGNYAFLWTHHGCADFREFLLRAGRDWDYFVTKLSHEPRVYDGVATLSAVKEYICQARRTLRWTRDEAREEWDLLDRYDRLWGEHDYAQWGLFTRLDASEFRRTRFDHQCEAFVKRTLGERLAPMLRAELDELAMANPSPPARERT